MSDNRIEGGERALLGFYFQMIVTLGISALTAKEVDKNETTGEGLFLMQPFPVRNFPTTLIPEQHGQDLTMLSGDVQMLLQMKHSGDPATYPFREADFRNILLSFANSYQVLKQGRLAVPDYFGIVTNRPASNGVIRLQQLVHKAQDVGKTEEGKLSNTSLAWANMLIDDNTTLRDELVRWFTIPPKKKGQKATFPANALVEALLYIFPRIFFVLDAPLINWQNAFHQFARTYGLLPDEIERKEYELLGRLVHPSGTHAQLTKRSLVAALTGYPDALDLTPIGAGRVCADRWHERSIFHHTREDWMIQRKINSLDAAVLTKKIIFITGDGGCGKSVLLAQITEPIIRKLPSDDWNGFALVESCHDLRSNWLERSIGLWGKRGAVGSASLDRPLERLGIANPSEMGRRLLWVALDGLDEQFPKEAELQWLVEIAKARNDLCVLFTCRKGDRQRVRDHLYRSDTGYPVRIEDDPDIEEITLTDFIDDELLTVISQAAGEDARNRILGVGPGLGAIHSPALPFVVESLRHPRMLGAFVIACNQDIELPQQVLDGTPNALRKVAREFLTLFLKKYDQRREERSLPEVGEFAHLLENMARRATQEKRHETFTKNEWIKTASEVLAVSRPIANRLLTEALSGGLIFKDGDADRYDWRHLFVMECLSEDALEDYWNG